MKCNWYLIILILISTTIISCQSKNDTQKKSSETTGLDNQSGYISALIIDGENNHGIWPKTTMMMKDFLEQTDLFNVDIYRTAYTWSGPHHNVDVSEKKIEFLIDQYPISKQTTAVEEPVADLTFSPNWSDYDVVISNLGWKASTWPAATVASFEDYMKNGGGLVIVHAANNSFGDWEEYNKMIGLGGWGGRGTKNGPYVYYNNNNELIKDPSDGQCGSHGAQHKYVITTREKDHPIMKDLPEKWLHTKDELYDRLRGPAENINVLATAFSGKESNGPPWNKDVKGTERHEPVLFTVDYGKGRMFHTILGHMDYSMECVGYITTFQRGTEWAATGNVTQKAPRNFPTETALSAINWDK